MRYLVIIVLTLFFSNCANNSLNNYDNTNPIKIEKSVQGLDIGKILPKPGSLDGRIAIKSIELDNSDNLDIGVAYMIEDNLITNLISNGYKVVERDPDILKVLHLESSGKYKKYSTDDSKVHNNIYNDANITIANATVHIDGKEEEEELEEFDVTELSSSDYILSYRVLECGIVYKDIENLDMTGSSMNSVERSARTKLHIRLTDAKTSEIIASDFLENEIVDVINKDDVDDLRQIPYEYYHHTLPNNGLKLSYYGFNEDSGYKMADEKTKIEGSDEEKKRKPIIDIKSKKFKRAALYAATGYLALLFLAVIIESS